MRNTWKLAPLAVLAVMLFGCGGGGSATPEGVGDAVVSAIQSEDFPGIYSSFEPWMPEYFQWRKDNEKFESETTKDWWKNHKDRYASGGDNSLDPGKKLEISDSEGYFGMEPATGAALHGGWYRKAHKWEKFTDRMADLRLVDKSARHGLEGDASGSLTYRNKYGDKLTITLNRIENVWYATGVELEGEEKLPTAE